MVQAIQMTGCLSCGTCFRVRIFQTLSRTPKPPATSLRSSVRTYRLLPTRRRLRLKHSAAVRLRRYRRRIWGGVDACADRRISWRRLARRIVQSNLLSFESNSHWKLRNSGTAMVHPQYVALLPKQCDASIPYCHALLQQRNGRVAITRFAGPFEQCRGGDQSGLYRGNSCHEGTYACKNILFQRKIATLPAGRSIAEHF